MKIVQIYKEEWFMQPAIINLRNGNRPTPRDSPILFSDWRLLRKQFAGRIETLVVVVIVRASVEGRAARLGRVFDESATGTPILSREIALDDLHLLHSIKGHRALLRIVVVNGAA